MQQSSLQVDDPLDGFRSSGSDRYAQLEEELLAFRSLAVDDENVELLRDILKKDEIMAALKETGGPFRRIATHAYNVFDQAKTRWVECDDPTSVEALNAHRDARAARLVIDWIAHQIEIGQQAQEQVEANE
jgi:hypothetical protein